MDYKIILSIDANNFLEKLKKKDKKYIWRYINHYLK
jgi:hypothetical protein